MSENTGTEAGTTNAWIANTVDKYRISPDCSKEEFIAVAKIYAREVVDEFSLSVSVRALEWNVSRRAKRRAGVVKYRNGTPESVTLTWEYFEQKGWDAVAETIRHELIHVHLLNEDREHGHGSAFQQLAKALDVRIHCRRFADPKWWVVCEDCGNKLARYRRSTVTEHPERYECGNCEGELIVERNS